MSERPYLVIDGIDFSKSVSRADVQATGDGTYALTTSFLWGRGSKLTNFAWRHAGKVVRYELWPNGEAPDGIPTDRQAGFAGTVVVPEPDSIVALEWTCGERPALIEGPK